MIWNNKYKFYIKKIRKQKENLIKKTKIQKN